MKSHSAEPSQIAPPSTPFLSAANDHVRHIPVTTYDINDILNGTNDCPVTMTGLQRLILAQAQLHRAHAVEDIKRLTNILEREGRPLRGFVHYAEEIGPIAYALYFPMIDGRGERIAYCEDFYITESLRGHGVASILFHELAKRVMADGGEKIQWATDNRNTPVHHYVQKRLGARPANLMTIAASDLLDFATPASCLMDAWNSKDYTTRRLTNADHLLPQQLGLSPNLIRSTGDFPFRGFVTFQKGQSDPVAITPGWTHLSTFRLKEGIHLEEPVFATTKPDEMKKITASTVHAARKLMEKSKLSYLRWHIVQDGSENGSEMRQMLHEHLKLPADSMLGTPDSELGVYNLSNGALRKLATEEPERVLHIASSSPIGSVPRGNKGRDTSLVLES